MDDKIVALVLAAGYSSRMGEFKPLLPVGSVPAIEHVINSFWAAGVEDVRVVVGYRAADLIPFLERMRVRYIINRDYDRGMFSSVQAGVSSLEQDAAAFFLLPVDYPLIKAEIVMLLLDFYRKLPAKIIYPCFTGKRGHPPLITAALRNEIMNCQPSDGLREILKNYNAAAFNAEVTDRAVLIDMDTRADYCDVNELAGEAVIPTVAGCRGLLAHYHVPPAVIAHGERVASVARRLAHALNVQGRRLSIELIVAAALLHDIAKGQHDHAGAGMQMLQTLGYPEVAVLVGSHMDLYLQSSADSIGAAEILYFADKIVQGDRIVSLTQRFAQHLAQFAMDEAAYAAVLQRFANAVLIKERIERITGQRLEEIIGVK